jgi:hypothetical protein
MMGLEPTTFCMASRRSSQLSYIRNGPEYSLGGPGLPGHRRQPNHPAAKAVERTDANLRASGATWRSGLRGGLQSPLHRFDSGRRL